MHQFFITPDQIGKKGILITDPSDVKHMKNVLRMRPGEKVSLCCEENEKEYICRISVINDRTVEAEVEDVFAPARELKAEITLFQGLPKGDKMDMVIQKAVELGASRIVPMASGRSVVRLDEKKARKKTARWQEIAKSAACQARRCRIPVVEKVMTFREALAFGRNLDMMILPYEDARGIRYAREIMASAADKKSIGIYIGPEGGFEPGEIEAAKEAGARIITLGHRILRTETAGMTVLSILSFMLDEDIRA